jgi:hypothetical protein
MVVLVRGLVSAPVGRELVERRSGRIGGIAMPIQIYHMTHWENLYGILRKGGLWCRAAMERSGLEYIKIADDRILRRRASKKVPVGPRGYLPDYVPFYFCDETPMLSNIKSNEVPGYDGGVGGVIQLVADIESLAEVRVPFVFTDGNAASNTTQFFADLTYLNKLCGKSCATAAIRCTGTFPRSSARDRRNVSYTNSSRSA